MKTKIFLFDIRYFCFLSLRFQNGKFKVTKKKLKAPFVFFSVSLPKNNYLANPKSDSDSSWKDLLLYNDTKIIRTLVLRFSNETVLAQQKKV